jgi:hypothetical protein
MVIVISTFFYVIKIKMVRQKLGWVLQVLVLLFAGMLSEIALASIYLNAEHNESDFGNTEKFFLVLLSLCGGVLISFSFVIFALEYYKASYTIAFAK